MGSIRPTEEANGNKGIEITYGGKESPFGGVDTSAPPAYIDPHCFAAADGFMIVDNKLVAASLQPMQIPTLWQGQVGVAILGFGTFYQTGYGQVNYIIGYKAIQFGTANVSPTGVDYTFYITTWLPQSPTVVLSDVSIDLTLFDSFLPATQATITLDCIGSGAQSNPATSGAVVNILAVHDHPPTYGWIEANSDITISGGLGYTIGDFITIVQGSNYGAVVQVTATGVGGSITGWNITGPCAGYVVGPASVLIYITNPTVLKITGPGGTRTYSVAYGTYSIITRQAVVAAMVTAINGSTTGFGASGTVTSVDGSGAILTGTMLGGSGYTVGEVVQAYAIAGFGLPGFFNVDAIDGLGGITASSVSLIGSGGTGYTNGESIADPDTGGDPDVIAAASPDGYSIVLTAVNPGTIGNTITVQDLSLNYTSVLPPIFYFACRTADNLTGGTDLTFVQAPRFFTTASIAEVGGTVYFGNLGSIILKYTEPGVFKTSTLYQGVGVLRKFAGSLIGLRLHPQLGVLVQNTDMVMAWTAGQDLDEWSPVTTAGNVTGAGFEQIADIGDFLSGLIVSNGTAFILRAQGISYATATGNAALPFAVNHIGLGDQGEGCQLPALICQYNETGVFVGNTNIFQISGQVTAIGEKIKNALFQALNSVAGLGATNLINSASCAINIGGNVFPVAALGVVMYTGTLALQSFIYNAANGTWMPFTYQSGVGIGAIDKALISPISTIDGNADAEVFNQTQLGYGFQQQISNVPQTPAFFVLKEGVPNSQSISNQAGVAFPQEEILFGRDITYDSLYLSLWANVSEHTFVDFYNNNVLYATLDLDPAIWNSVNGNPKELGLFPLPSYGAGAVTGQAPQITYKVRSLSDTGVAFIRFAKIMLLGSVDPEQRPT